MGWDKKTRQRHAQVRQEKYDSLTTDRKFELIRQRNEEQSAARGYPCESKRELRRLKELAEPVVVVSKAEHLKLKAKERRAAERKS